MIYILILLWSGDSTSFASKAAVTAEFNSIEACRAASIEINRQSNGSDRKLVVAACVQKGKP